MNDIAETIKALRYCSSGDASCPCKWAEDNPTAEHYEDRLFLQAADAIEALQAENMSLRIERDQARLDCAIAEHNHMDTLARLLDAQERITELSTSGYVTQKQFEAAIKQLIDFGRAVSYLNNKYHAGLNDVTIQEIMDKWRGELKGYNYDIY